MPLPYAEAWRHQGRGAWSISKAGSPGLRESDSPGAPPTSPRDCAEKISCQNLDAFVSGNAYWGTPDSSNGRTTSSHEVKILLYNMREARRTRAAIFPLHGDGG